MPCAMLGRTCPHHHDRRAGALGTAVDGRRARHGEAAGALAREGFGLTSMRQRAIAIGGEWQIESRAGRRHAGQRAAAEAQGGGVMAAVLTKKKIRVDPGGRPSGGERRPGGDGQSASRHGSGRGGRRRRGGDRRSTSSISRT